MLPEPPCGVRAWAKAHGLPLPPELVNGHVWTQNTLKTDWAYWSNNPEHPWTWVPDHASAEWWTAMSKRVLLAGGSMRGCEDGHIHIWLPGLNHGEVEMTLEAAAEALCAAVLGQP